MPTQHTKASEHMVALPNEELARNEAYGEFITSLRSLAKARIDAEEIETVSMFAKHMKYFKSVNGFPKVELSAELRNSYSQELTDYQKKIIDDKLDLLAENTDICEASSIDAGDAKSSTYSNQCVDIPIEECLKGTGDIKRMNPYFAWFCNGIGSISFSKSDSKQPFKADTQKISN
jgi:hypothetical protein